MKEPRVGSRMGSSTEQIAKKDYRQNLVEMGPKRMPVMRAAYRQGWLVTRSACKKAG